MPKKRQTKSRSARSCIGTGLGGAAMVGVGALVAAAAGESDLITVAPPVALASFDSILAPHAPADPIEPWWLGGDSGNPGGNTTPTPTALAAAVALPEPGQPMFGTNGWLIGDGAGCPRGL